MKSRRAAGRRSRQSGPRSVGLFAINPNTVLTLPVTLQWYSCPAAEYLVDPTEVVSIFMPLFNSLNSLWVIPDSMCTRYLIYCIRKLPFQIYDDCLALVLSSDSIMSDQVLMSYCGLWTTSSSCLYFCLVLCFYQCCGNSHAISDLWKSDSHAP